jgi:hypothetical protein
MSALADLLALTALVPAMTGPVMGNAAPENLTALTLCHGGSILVPLGEGGTPDPGTQPCCAKGCHRGKRQRRDRVIDPEQ